MDTSYSGYGRCGGCGEIKQVTDGAVQAHNRYSTQSTSLVVDRCPGSDRPPRAADQEAATR